MLDFFMFFSYLFVPKKIYTRIYLIILLYEHTSPDKSSSTYTIYVRISFESPQRTRYLLKQSALIQTKIQTKSVNGTKDFQVSKSVGWYKF